MLTFALLLLLLVSYISGYENKYASLVTVITVAHKLDEETCKPVLCTPESLGLTPTLLPR